MEDVEILKLECVSYRPETTELLSGISFSVSRGESVIIFGPEDSGIEKICPVIAGLIKEYEGDIFYKGKSINDLDYLETHTYRKELGYLQRDYGLINNMSVFENIALPLRYHSSLSGREIEELVNKQINGMNLLHCRNSRPFKLTRAERLKTAFLRSIILNPDLLLIEHPVDGQCMFNIQSFFYGLKKELLMEAKAAVLITYYPKLFIDLADKFIMIYKGHIVFAGSRQEFALSDNKYLQQYFNMSPDGPMSVI